MSNLEDVSTAISGLSRNRNQYHLSQNLPLGVGEEILAKSREFLEFLVASKATTHPVVRNIHHGVESQLALLVGMVEAERLREEGRNGENEEG